MLGYQLALLQELEVHVGNESYMMPEPLSIQVDHSGFVLAGGIYKAACEVHPLVGWRMRNESAGPVIGALLELVHMDSAQEFVTLEVVSWA